MRITQWGEYGILCTLYMAKRAQEGARTVGAPEIAESQGIALQYTQQILQRLRRGNIIESARGPHGGYCLARSATELTLHDILSAAEGDTFEVICETKPLGHEQCIGELSCGLRVVWRELREHLNVFLKDKKLSAILAEHLCNSPTNGKQHGTSLSHS